MAPPTRVRHLFASLEQVLRAARTGSGSCNLRRCLWAIPSLLCVLDLQMCPSVVVGVVLLVPAASCQFVRRGASFVAGPAGRKRRRRRRRRLRGPRRKKNKPLVELLFALLSSDSVAHRLAAIALVLVELLVAELITRSLSRRRHLMLPPARMRDGGQKLA